MTKTKLEPWQLEDARRLERLYAKWSSEAKESQAKFGADNQIGTQGMVSQYLKAVRPLNLVAAMRFAKGLGVQLREISPTLSGIAREAVSLDEDRPATAVEMPDAATISQHAVRTDRRPSDVRLAALLDELRLLPDDRDRIVAEVMDLSRKMHDYLRETGERLGVDLLKGKLDAEVAAHIKPAPAFDPGDPDTDRRKKDRRREPK